ncbi:SufD family Fe-S cluster assembly protein [bacterium]|nr:SufBD protein [bacterium]MBU3956271.1 SufD family Fe-S cluster assembly protein [bacterium]
MINKKKLRLGGLPARHGALPTSALEELLASINKKPAELHDTHTAHLVVHHNKVLGAHLVPGLKMDVNEMKDGIRAVIKIKDGTIIENPVQICFGMLPEKGIQKILMDVNCGKNSKISIIAHCSFPNALDITHIMDAKINIEEGAEYRYFERHVHGGGGGTKVYPKAKVNLEKGARFATEFELIKGRVGLIDINYETNCGEDSSLEMTARISGYANDIIRINETGHLNGENSRGFLNSRIAVRDSARADIYNKLTASAAGARGHVDCKEIVQDKAAASATPVVEVSHPQARITHEAAIGSVDSKQLQTLMARGLSEKESVALIIRGLLK